MRTPSSTRSDQPRPCGFHWCVTDHGSTVHPDDEDHRSAGFATVVRARRGDARGTGEDTELEVGALRRRDDTETWLVIETGIGVSLALTRAGASTLQRRLLRELGPGGAFDAAATDV